MDKKKILVAVGLVALVVLIGVALALVFFNGAGVSGVELPRESQGASVSLVL